MNGEHPNTREAPTTETELEWQSIESAPKDGSMLWLFRKSERQQWGLPVVGYWNRSDEDWPWCFIDVKEGRMDAYRDDEYGPTHWKAIRRPEPPK